MNKRNIKQTNLLLIFIIIRIIPLFISKQAKMNEFIYDNEITIKIKGNGNQAILTSNAVIPSQIYLNVNDDPITGDKTVYNLNSEDNTIRMVWVSQLSNCKSMFKELINIIEIDLSKFDSSKVTDMSEMFKGCSNLTLINFTNIDTSSVTNMYQMFYGCGKLTSLDLSNFNTSSLTKMSGMFYHCYALQIVNISSFDTKKVDTMERMFFRCHSLKSVDTSIFDTSLVESMIQMFFECNELESLDLSTLDTSKITTMKEMFKDCYSLTSLDISNFNTSLVESMENMFTNCKLLKSLNVSSFDTSNVKFFDNMFNGCESLEFLDVSNFVTSSATKTNSMFSNCKSLKSLDLSNFDISKVQTINSMFYHCHSLKHLELGNFNTSSVTDMSQLFLQCRSLTFINLNSFTTPIVNSYNNMFINSNISLYCINEDIKEEIKSQLSSYVEVNCSDLCYANSKKKYIKEKNICIDDCKNDKTFIFEYANICFSECPNGTHLIGENLCEKDLICNNYYNYEQTDCLDYIPLGYYLNNTEKKTLDKCNIKCSNCTRDSILNNALCISCNNSAGYYQKYNDSLNYNEFINCYNEKPYGYYLDNEEKIYNPCHSSCKDCIGKGTIGNYQCSECYTNYALADGNCELITEVAETETIESSTEKVPDKESSTETMPDKENSTEKVPDKENSTEKMADIESSNIILDDYIIMTSIITQEGSYLPRGTIPSDTTMDKTKEINKNIYSYYIDDNLEDLIDEFKNVTFINFLKKDVEFIYSFF